MKLLVKNQHKIGTAQKQKSNKHRRMNKRMLEIEARNAKLETALRDLVVQQNCGSFPERQCAANRGRMLLEKLEGY